MEITDQPVFSAETLPSVPDKVGYHAASVCELDNGKLLAAWYSYGDHGDELAGSAIYTSMKDAHGWSVASVFRDSPQGDGNPVLYAEGNKVWLFQAVVPGGWSTAHIEFQWSEGQDNSWSAPAVVSSALGSNVRFPPIRLKNGELLLPAYDDLLSRSLFFASSDGVNWQERAALSTGLSGTNIQPSIAQLDDGDIVAVMRDTTAHNILVSFSSDNGATWTKPIASPFPNPGAPSAIVKLKSGRLLLVYNNMSLGARDKLSAALSPDDGVTWTAPKVIAEVDSSYPTAIQGANGMIHVVYSSGREAIIHAEFNEAWVASKD